MNAQAMRAYILARAKEASTWRGLVLLATAGGLSVKPELTDVIVGTGLGVAGLIGAGFPDSTGAPPAPGGQA